MTDTQQIHLHLKATVTDSGDVNIADIILDMPINLEPTRTPDGHTVFIPKTDPQAFTQRLTKALAAFTTAFHDTNPR